MLTLEADSSLAEQARKHGAAYVNVEVRCATGVDPEDGCFDAIFVNTGATEVCHHGSSDCVMRAAYR